MNPPIPDSPDPMTARVLKLEEAQAFSERAAEQLSAELYQLHRQVDDLAQRLATVERRMERMAGGEGDGPGGGAGEGREAEP